MEKLMGFYRDDGIVISCTVSVPIINETAKVTTIKGNASGSNQEKGTEGCEKMTV